MVAGNKAGIEQSCQAGTEEAENRVSSFHFSLFGLVFHLMLSDRSYMRDTYPDRKVSILTWLVAAIVAAFVIQNLFLRIFNAGPAVDMLALSAAGLRAGHVWTLVTYSLLHSPDNLLHIVCNLVGLYFIGREVLSLLGGRRFLGFYLGMAICGGF